MRKPTGTAGTLRLGSTPEGTLINEFQQTEFPKEKQAIELMIATDFVRLIGDTLGPAGRRLEISDLKQNEEDDLDFSITGNGTASYLELLEAAPLTGPYEKAPDSYRVGEYAAYILSKIGDKVMKYGRNDRPIYLLVYATHWAFMLSDSTVSTLRYWLASLPTSFAGVFLYMPVMNVGSVQWLDPSDIPAGFHPNVVTSNKVTKVDPRAIKGSHGPDGTSYFSVDLKL